MHACRTNVSTYGNYEYDNLDKEMNMIDLNVKGLHILTKLFVNNAAIKGKITKGDYLALFDSNKCPSYNEFIEDLLEIE